MNYGELRTQFLDFLDRDDTTNSQADGFIAMAVRHTERTLRTPVQQTTMTVTVESDWPGYMYIPYDYLAMKQITIDGYGIRRETTTGAGPQYVGVAESWYIEDNKIVFRGDVSEGDTIKMSYYSDFASVTDDTDTLSYTVVLPDLIMFRALFYACLFYTDDRATGFNALADTIHAETQKMADLEEVSGGIMQVRNPYEGVV